jgi:hypothetical protein
MARGLYRGIEPHYHDRIGDPSGGARKAGDHSSPSGQRPRTAGANGLACVSPDVRLFPGLPRARGFPDHGCARLVWNDYQSLTTGVCKFIYGSFDTLPPRVLVIVKN